MILWLQTLWQLLVADEDDQQYNFYMLGFKSTWYHVPLWRMFIYAVIVITIDGKLDGLFFFYYEELKRW